jgi:hypothetical protein
MVTDDTDFLSALLSDASPEQMAAWAAEEAAQAARAAARAAAPVSDPEGDRFRQLQAAADACKAKGGTVLAQLATVWAVSLAEFPRTTI